MKKILSILICMFCIFSAFAKWEKKSAPLMSEWAEQVAPDNVWPEYPRPQMQRADWLNLNGLWEYEASNENGKPRFNKALREKILVPFPIEAALSGIMQDGKKVDGRKLDAIRPQYLHYRRTFEIPSAWNGKRVKINFGGVDWMCWVYVNGKEAGKHSGGYAPFSLDITDCIKDGENELFIRVYDPTEWWTQPLGKQRVWPNGYWYTPTSGIWQTVWLEPVDQSGIERLKMVPKLSNGELAFEALGRDGNADVEVDVLDGEKKVAGAASKMNRNVNVKIADPKLWSPDSPFLYGIKIRVKKDGIVVDEVESYVGMREIGMKDVAGFMRPTLNGEPIFHMGTLDQGYWPDGNYLAPTDEALRFDIEAHKKLGFNCVRKHIKTEPARWYYWADKLGLMVWQDMPAMRTHADVEKTMNRGFIADKEAKNNFKKEWKEIIESLYNHPSIVQWVVFNEGWGQLGYSKEETAELSNWTKSLDRSRDVNNASGDTDSGAGEVRDIHDYPGPAAPLPETSRYGVLGEYGGIGYRVEGHMWTEGKGGGYGSMPKDFDELTERYLVMLDKIRGMMYEYGLSGAIYTQITDVENELNGIYTYDRKVLKMNAAAVKKGHELVYEALKNPARIEKKKDYASMRLPVSKLSNGEFKTVYIAKSNAPAGDFVNQSMSVRIAARPAKGSAGLVFRSSEGMFYYAGISADGKVFLRSKGGRINLDLEADSEVPPSASFTIKIEAFSSALRVYVNDMKNPKISTENSMFPYGRSGVFAENCEPEFSEFKIENPVNCYASYNYRFRAITFKENSGGILRGISTSDSSRALDAFWDEGEGLSGEGVSLESLSRPGHYLTLGSDGNVYVQKDDKSDDFKKRASWRKHKGLADEKGVSFESVASPGMFIRHSGSWLKISKIGSGELDKNDSTWILRE